VLGSWFLVLGAWCLLPGCSGFGVRDAGCGTRDAGCETRDAGRETRDAALGCLGRRSSPVPKPIRLRPARLLLAHFIPSLRDGSDLSRFASPGDESPGYRQGVATRRQCRVTRYASRKRCLVLGSSFLVLCSWFLVPRSWCLVLGVSCFPNPEFRTANSEPAVATTEHGPPISRVRDEAWRPGRDAVPRVCLGPSPRKPDDGVPLSLLLRRGRGCPKGG